MPEESKFNLPRNINIPEGQTLADIAKKYENKVIVDFTQQNKDLKEFGEAMRSRNQQVQASMDLFKDAYCEQRKLKPEEPTLALVSYNIHRNIIEYLHSMGSTMVFYGNQIKYELWNVELIAYYTEDDKIKFYYD